MSEVFISTGVIKIQLLGLLLLFTFVASPTAAYVTDDIPVTYEIKPDSYPGWYLLTVTLVNRSGFEIEGQPVLSLHSRMGLTQERHTGDRVRLADREPTKIEFMISGLPNRNVSFTMKTSSGPIAWPSGWVGFPDAHVYNLSPSDLLASIIPTPGYSSLLLALFSYVICLPFLFYYLFRRKHEEKIWFYLPGLAGIFVLGFAVWSMTQSENRVRSVEVTLFDGGEAFTRSVTAIYASRGFDRMWTLPVDGAASHHEFDIFGYPQFETLFHKDGRTIHFTLPPRSGGVVEAYGREDATDMPLEDIRDTYLISPETTPRSVPAIVLEAIQDRPGTFVVGIRKPQKNSPFSDFDDIEETRIGIWRVAE